MEITLHRNFSEIESEAWNALLSESITDTPFLRYEYQRAWWDHLGGGEWKNAELVLISASENGRLVGIAPLFLTEYDGRPALMLVGSIEISDYLDLIVRPANLPRFVSALYDYLASSPTENWRALDWYNIPDSSPTLAALREESAKRGWAYQEEIYRPTPRIALNGDFDEYLSRLEKKQRHEIRRKMRRAAESGKVRFYVVDKDADIRAEMDSFFHLMVQDPNKAVFLRDAMRDQMSTIIQQAHAQGYLWLGVLEVDGIKVAASLNFDYKNKLWGYNSGVSRDFMELSPGWVLLAHVIQWCCEHGRTEFDFMRGDEEYKYRFGGVNRFVMRARAAIR